MKNFKIKSLEIYVGEDKKVSFEFGDNLNVIGAHSQIGKSLIFSSLLLSMGGEEVIKKFNVKSNFRYEERAKGVRIETKLDASGSVFTNQVIIKNNDMEFLTIHEKKRYIGYEAQEVLLEKLFYTLFKTPDFIGLNEHISKPTVNDYLMPLFISQKNIQQDKLWQTVSSFGSKKTKYALIVQSARGKLDSFIDIVQENKRAIVANVNGKSIERTRELLFPNAPTDKGVAAPDIEESIDQLQEKKRSLLKKKRDIYKERRFVNNIKSLIVELNDDVDGIDNEDTKKILNKLMDRKKAKIIKGLSNKDFNLAGDIDNELAIVNESIKSLTKGRANYGALYDFMNEALSEKMDEVSSKAVKVNDSFNSIRNKFANELGQTQKNDELKILQRLDNDHVDVSNIREIFGSGSDHLSVGSGKSGLEKCLITNVAFLTVIKLITNNVKLPYVIDSPLETNISSDERQKNSKDAAGLFYSIANEYLNTGAQTIVFTGLNDFSEQLLKLEDTKAWAISGEKNSLLSTAKIENII